MIDFFEGGVESTLFISQILPLPRRTTERFYGVT